MLLPGLDGTGLLFRPLLMALPTGIDPIVVRYPGDRPLSYAELVNVVLKTLPKSKPFILLGESFGGPLAVMVAATNPDGLVGVVLCATFIQKPWRRVGRIIPILARPFPFRFYLPYKQLKARLGGYSTPKHRAVLAEMRRLVRPSVIAARIRMVFKVDVTEALRQYQLPMMYLLAEHDRMVPSWNLARIQQVNPNVRVVRFDSSHMILQRHPVAAAAAIVEFASEIGFPI